MATSPLGFNPVLQELDNLSPQAKQAALTAHHGIVAQQQPPALGASPAAPAPTTSAAPAPAPIAGLPPKVPTLGQAPDPTAAQAHQTELNRLTTGETGKSGIAQIHNPWARIPLQIADAVGGGFVPGLEQRLPGTQGHHDVLVKQAQGNVAQDEAQASDQQKRGLEAAQTTNENTLPELNAAKGEIAGQKEALAEVKQSETTQHHQQQLDSQLAQHGYKRDEQGNIQPLSYQEMSQDQQAIHDLKASQSELADANAAYKKAQKENIPAAMQMAEARIRTAQANASTAAGRLGLSQQKFNADYLGEAPGGGALPGAPADETGHAIGLKTATLTKPTNTTRTAAERAQTMDALDSRIRQGLKDPEILKYMGPAGGRLAEAQGKLGTLPQKVAQFKNDLVSYGAFQSGLHPVRGVDALKYFDAVMGGLGQNPDQLLGKLDSNKATSASVERIGGMRTVNSAPQQHQVPQVGMVEGGYRFKGGDPSKQTSWEKVQ